MNSNLKLNFNGLLTLQCNESSSVFKSWHKKDKERILHYVLILPPLSFQIRPEIPTPDELDEDEDDEGGEKDVDLSIPGSCYLRLLSLTAPLVLPGDSCSVAWQLAFFRDFTCLIVFLLWCTHMIAHFNYSPLSIWKAQHIHLLWRYCFS